MGASIISQGNLHWKGGRTGGFYNHSSFLYTLFFFLSPFLTDEKNIMWMEELEAVCIMR